MQMKFDGAKPMGKIGGEKIMYKRGLIPNSVFTCKLLVPETTMKNVQKGTRNAATVQFENMMDFIEQHKDEIFEADKKYRLNILTGGGWVGGQDFYGNAYNVFDPTSHYGKECARFGAIYAVQIVEY